MTELTRVSISLEESLLAAYDKHIGDKGYANRSEAIRDLIRDSLVGQEWNENKDTIATITFVYDHHVPDLTREVAPVGWTV